MTYGCIPNSHELTTDFSCFLKKWLSKKFLDHPPCSFQVRWQTQSEKNAKRSRLIAKVWIANSVHCLHFLISNNSLMKNFTAHFGLAKTQESIKYLVQILKENLHRHTRRNHTLSPTFIQVFVALLPLLAAVFCKLFTLYLTLYTFHPFFSFTFYPRWQPRCNIT